MARRETNKIQVSGYQWLGRGLESAVVLGETDQDKATYLSRHRQAALVITPCVIGAIALTAFLLSWIKPAPNRAMSEIEVTREGGTYVMYQGRLHDALNLASARLIVGKPDAVSIVSEASLEGIPRGQQMGIPGAPNTMLARTDRTAQWAVCDWRDYTEALSLERGTGPKTTVIAGEDMLSGGRPLSGSRAVLARTYGKDATLWLVFGDRKAQVGMRDYATWQALNITADQVEHAPMFSEGVMNSIHTAPILSVPQIAKRGEVSAVVSHALNGDVMVTSKSDGSSDFYVVLDDGVQRVPPLIADLFLNTGSGRISVPDPHHAAWLPQRYRIDVDQFPTVAPEIVNPTSMCSVWRKGPDALSAETSVITADTLPVAPENAEKVTVLVPIVGAAKQADASLTEPGKGWYVRVTGDAKSSLAKEQLFYIADSGMAYPLAPDGVERGDGINYDAVVGALGLNTQLPLPIPWSVMSLYGRGPTLDIAAARTEHGTPPVDPQQRPMPDKPGDVPAN